MSSFVSIWLLYRALAVDSGNPRMSTYHVTVTFCTVFGLTPDASRATAQSRATVGLSGSASELSDLATVGMSELSEMLEFAAAAMVKSGTGLVAPVVLVSLAPMVQALAWV